VSLEQFPEIAPFLFGRAGYFAQVAMVPGHEPDQTIPPRRLHDKVRNSACKLTIMA
jgi:hypothetical protein